MGYRGNDGSPKTDVETVFTNEIVSFPSAVNFVLKTIFEIMP